MGGNGGSILDLLWIILVLAVVFYMTWLVTRFVANRAKGRTAGRFMRTVDRMAISNDKTLLLVKIGADYCVLGVTGHQISHIKTLSAEEAEAFEGGSRQEPAQDWAPQGAAGTVWKGMQGFSERLGIAMRGPRSGPRPSAGEEKQPDEQSVIDMMNERVRLRKDSRRR